MKEIWLSTCYKIRLFEYFIQSMLMLHFHDEKIIFLQININGLICETTYALYDILVINIVD